MFMLFAAMGRERLTKLGGVCVVDPELTVRGSHCVETLGV